MVGGDEEADGCVLDNFRAEVLEDVEGWLAGGVSGLVENASVYGGGHREIERLEFRSGSTYSRTLPRPCANWNMSCVMFSSEYFFKNVPKGNRRSSGTGDGRSNPVFQNSLLVTEC